MAKFSKEEAVDGKWSRWIQPVQGFKMACGDCGLVHNFEFNILQVTGISPDDPKSFNAEVLPWGEYRVEWRVSRNNRSTGQLRRHQKK